ncbi:MAG: NADH-quinone oxidoreductase subunit M [Thaumarchaeota archaeon]|nr:NADH-quinone oxidoreductase subunit M [Nitrososphaerota archaeon]
MYIPNPLLQSVLIPMVASIVLAILGRKNEKIAGWIAALALTYSSILLLLVGEQIWVSAKPIYEEYAWSSVVGLKFGLLADGLSLPTALIMNLIVTASSFYSIPYIKHRIELLYGEDHGGMYSLYFVIYLLFAVGLTGVALSTNLIEMYLFVELALIPSYFMIDLYGYRDRHRIAMMYFIWNHLGACLFLVGIVLAYVGSGSFEISKLSSLTGYSAFLVSFFVLIGWLVKMAVFGLHVWLPYAHGEHPTSIASIIATIVGLGNYVIVRLLVEHLFEAFQAFGIPLMIWALITMIYGAFLTIAQDDVKRLYACSTISQTAYSLLGIGSLTALGIAGGVFYFLSHIIGKCILFSIAGIIVYQTGIRDMRKLGGLAKSMPLTAVAAIIGSMILSAIPPLSGFQAEWIMFAGIFQQGFHGSAMGLLIALIGIFATFLTAVYTFWPIKRMFFGPAPENLNNIKRAPLLMTIPLLVLGIISVIMGVYPDVVMRFLNSVIH